MVVWRRATIYLFLTGDEVVDAVNELMDVVVEAVDAVVGATVTEKNYLNDC